MLIADAFGQHAFGVFVPVFFDVIQQGADAFTQVVFFSAH
jgi:hypothetical protein